MKDWRKTLIPPTTTIMSALETLDRTAAQIVLVVDKDDRLLGTVTDGDVRRCILRGIPLSASVEEAMNRAPIVAMPDMDNNVIYSLMADSHLHQVPQLDKNRRVIGLYTVDDMVGRDAIQENRVVIMAGGLGTRLRPLTDEMPKPLLKVGGRPILETIIVNLHRQGFRHIYLAVNYKADMVKAYFGHGDNWNLNIRYLEEKDRLGTAGALGLLSETPEYPLIVMNGDLLTTVNFRSMIDFHKQNRSMATVGVREYDVQVPFGVVNLNGSAIYSVDEKPVKSYLINAGVYVIDPGILPGIPKGAPLDMTDLITNMLTEGKTVTAFPIREYWLDIGRMDDFSAAKKEFSKVFD